MKVAFLSFVAHRAVGLAACCLLTLVQGSLIERVGAEGLHKPSVNVIQVWTVGSPFTDNLPQAAVPLELQRQAENLGSTIQVRTFRAVGFAAKFRQALQEHNEPEVLTFDNYGLIRGITTPAGRIEGLDADSQAASSLVLVHEALTPLQPRGWVMLVRSAVNYEAARALSMQPPVCADLGPEANSLTQPELGQTLETAAMAARAFLACDQSSLAGISDESRLGRKCFLPEANTQVEAVKACTVSGNRNLAFISLVGTFSAQVREPYSFSGSATGMDLGHKSILAVLRNQGAGWRLLAITDDPVNTVARIPVTTQRLAGLLDDMRTAGTAPEPARLLTPDGAYPRPSQGERFADFIWQPSQSTEVIGQVVEFMFGKDSSRGRTRLFFLDVRQGRLSSGLLMSGGTSAWRVWSISRAGTWLFLSSTLTGIDPTTSAARSRTLTFAVTIQGGGG